MSLLSLQAFVLLFPGMDQEHTIPKQELTCRFVCIAPCNNVIIRKVAYSETYLGGYIVASCISRYDPGPGIAIGAAGKILLVCQVINRAIEAQIFI